jgi:hypothetical protein
VPEKATLLAQQKLNSTAAQRQSPLAMPHPKKHAMNTPTSPSTAPNTAPNTTTNATPSTAPKGFLDRLFARLEFLMSKRTMSDRARY